MTTFAEKYNSIYNQKERTRIRREIIETCGISYVTFRRWTKGYTIKPWFHKAIAKIMSTTVQELFSNN